MQRLPGDAGVQQPVAIRRFAGLIHDLLKWAKARIFEILCSNALKLRVLSSGHEKAVHEGPGLWWKESHCDRSWMVIPGQVAMTVENLHQNNIFRLLGLSSKERINLESASRLIRTWKMATWLVSMLAGASKTCPKIVPHECVQDNPGQCIVTQDTKKYPLNGVTKTVWTGRLWMQKNKMRTVDLTEICILSTATASYGFSCLPRAI